MISNLKIPIEQVDEIATLEPERKLVTTKQAAIYIGSSQRFLEIGRMKGYGPKFVRCAPKMIRYRIEDLESWIQDRIRRSTSDDGSAA